MSTFVTRYLESIERHPDEASVVFLADGETDERVMTKARLDQAARAVAARLRDKVSVGDRVLIMCEPGLDYIAAFLGCLYAGTIAVPAYPPSPMALERSAERLRAVITDSGARHAVTSPLLDAAFSDNEIRRATLDKDFTWTLIDVENESDDDGRDFEIVHRSPSDPVFLQYTSGSTMNPKGVVITDENLLANIGMICQRFGLDQATSAVSWLPPYHDMGLIGVMLTGLISLERIVLMSPESFLKRPVRWLYALDRYRGYASPAPNFAFELCARRATDADVEALDLSDWKVAINGAEPIDHRTIDAFLTRFGPSGFAESSLWPSYGLAEATLLQAAGSLGVTSHRVQVDVDALAAGRLERGEGERTVELITCGTPTDGSRIAIIDEDGHELAPGQVGEIIIEGDHVAPRYWGDVDPDAFGRTADGTRKFTTGDLGTFIDGELVVTGRRKDLIVIRGRNHYPQDIERTAELSDPRVRPGCGVAFSVPDAGGSDQLVLVYELRETDPSIGEELVTTVRTAVNENHGVRPSAIMLLGPRTLPKTSSGKVQRAPTKAALLRGDLSFMYEWRSTGLETFGADSS